MFTIYLIKVKRQEHHWLDEGRTVGSSLPLNLGNKVTWLRIKELNLNSSKLFYYNAK